MGNMMNRKHQKNIALFGGSFNPPHKGHGQVLAWLAGLTQFDEVWLVPSFGHPFLKRMIPFSHRVRLCQLLVADWVNDAVFKKDSSLKKKVKVSSFEKKMGKKPVYTYNLLTRLKKEFPGVKWTLVLGSDCKKDLHRWKNYKGLLKKADFYFIPRAGFHVRAIHELPLRFLDISSTELREKLPGKKGVKKYISPSVLKYIRDKKLYENSPRP